MSSMKEGINVDNHHASERKHITTTLASEQEETLVALLEEIEPTHSQRTGEEDISQGLGGRGEVVVHRGDGGDTTRSADLGSSGGYQQLLTSGAGCCCQRPLCQAFQRTQTLKAKVLELESKNDLAGRYGQTRFKVMSLEPNAPSSTIISILPHLDTRQETLSLCLDQASLLENSSSPSTSLTFMLQTLLQRHESLVASFTQERKTLMMQIEELTQANVDLESQNRATLLENRELVEHLEGLNSSISGKDDRITSLSADLRRTEEELARMGRMSGRAIPELERQLERLEEDLLEAQTREETVGEEGRVATLRWQQSERTIGFLQEQLERIEKEAREERERHADVLERVQRRRTIEAELAAKNGRQWKSAQAGPPSGMSHIAGEDSGESNGAVGNFVTDLLQDNANLQVGIVELRDMLHRSNEEIERLREQLLLQAPDLADRSDMPSMLPPAAATSLSSELTESSPAREIHVHHHYHAPSRGITETRQSRSTSSRRRSKKRDSVSARGSISGIKSPISGYAASLPRTITGNSSKRWSTQSYQTTTTAASSLPSSPYDSVFDRAYGETTDGDISRPSTPDSLELSPRLGSSAYISAGFRTDATGHSRKNSVDSILLSPTDPISERSSSEGYMSAKAAGKQPMRETSYQDPSHSIILEENEDLDSSHTTPDAKMKGKIPQSPITPTRPPNFRTPISTAEVAATSNIPSFMAELNRPSLRRHASHESLISVGGMDIHTLQTRPSQLLLGRYIAPVTALSVATTSTASAMTAKGVALMTTDYTQSHRVASGDGASASSATRSTSATYLSGIIAGRQGGVARSAAPRKSSPATTSSSNNAAGLGSRIGGWSMFGRAWGSAANASPSPSTPTPAVVKPTVTTATIIPPASFSSSVETSQKSIVLPLPSSTLSIPSPSSPFQRPSTASSSSTATSTQRSTLSASALVGSPSSQIRSKKPVNPRSVSQLRSYGVNQSGPIFGFGPEKKLDPVVKVSGLNVDALRESLADG